MNIEIIEQTIEKLDSVVTCKIILGENEAFNEIHIVSNGGRSAKQLVRDIQSVLIATYNIQIDHKKISIAEIQDDSLKRAESRLKIVSVSHEKNGQRATVKVSLDNHRDIFENSINGINTSRNIDRMLVDITLKTVEDAYGYEDAFILEDIKTVNVSTEQVVIVIIMAVHNGSEQRICGSSLVGSDYKEAVVEASLDAINRYVSK
ncbi:hypothetical protein [Tissierella sp.]|uniref:hypothetical protein n=1 Tax=Tissierella sp. TaxID=41274 RepID=UPI0028566086|nr:hypothetical protein [Tissierella sp.]MDR7857603.1 hypothetical protein [Tissierella sp.]